MNKYEIKKLVSNMTLEEKSLILTGGGVMKTSEIEHTSFGGFDSNRKIV